MIILKKPTRIVVSSPGRTILDFLKSIKKSLYVFKYDIKCVLGSRGESGAMKPVESRYDDNILEHRKS